MHSQDNTQGTPSQKGRAYKISLKRAKVTGILCLALICVVLIFMSPIFSIKSIVVNPGEFLETEAVLKAVGFQRGDNIFSIDLSNAAKNVEKLDRVGSCDIVRTLPGKVTVTVNDKCESGYIKIDSGYAGIDEMGKVIVITKTLEQKAPLISGTKVTEASKGDYIKFEDKNAKEKTDYLIRLLGALKEHDLTSHIKQSDISDMKNVSLTLVTGTVVNLGTDGKDAKDKVEYKIAFLKAILDKDYPEHGGIIELSDTDNVTARMS